MYHHLYIRQALCPVDKFDIDLTDEIKAKIMKDRSYNPNRSVSKQTPQHITITNNIVNIMNTISPLMSSTDRLTKYLEYTGKEAIPVCDNIENMYKNETLKLQNDDYRYGISLTNDDLLEVMDRICRSEQKDHTDMNVVFDPVSKKICMVDDTLEWTESLTNKGLKDLVEKVQDGYLHEYERYMVKKILGTNGQMNQHYKEQLMEYYKFILCFDLPPLCSEACKPFSDQFVTNEIIDTFYPIYKNVKENMKRYENTTTRKAVLDIVRRNSEKNLKSLYVTMYELFSSDAEFRPLLL
jgi:hypothetical protein